MSDLARISRSFRSGPVETVLLRTDIQVDQNGNIPKPQAQHIFGMIQLSSG